MEGRKSLSPIDLAHGLYNSLYYRTSRDTFIVSRHVCNNFIRIIEYLYFLVTFSDVFCFVNL